MNMDTKYARLTVARGLSHWERQDFEAALETFREVLTEYPRFADVHNKAGLCLAMLGRHEEALAHFDLAVEENPAYAEAHVNRGIVLNELGRVREAQDAFACAGDLDRQDERTFPAEVGNRIAVTHAQLGDLYLVAERPREALEHYRRALEIRPRFADIRSKYAEALIEIGEFEEARVELETILEARPTFVGARVRLGVVFRKLGDDERAIREWERCAREDPADMRARAYLASAGVGFAGAPGPGAETGTDEGRLR